MHSLHESGPSHLPSIDSEASRYARTCAPLTWRRVWGASLLGAGLTLCSACTLLRRSDSSFTEDVHELVETRNQDIAECYDVALAASDLEARPSGSVTVDLTFQETTAGRKPSGAPMGRPGALDGHLRGVTVVDTKTTAPKELVECVTRSLIGLVLEPPDHRPAHGEVTFVFEIGSDAPAPAADLPTTKTPEAAESEPVNAESAPEPAPELAPEPAVAAGTEDSEIPATPPP